MLAEKQREALRTALASKVMVITGGPGTGKTTIIRARLLILKLCLERIPARFGLDPVLEIQVLSPMHRGPAGGFT